MPYFSFHSYFVRIGHGFCSFAVLYALLYFKTDLSKALSIRDFYYAGPYFILFGLALYLYYKTCLMDPGFVRVSPFHQIIYECPSGSVVTTPVTLRFCGFCGMKQPLRARHCEECRRCVHKFDHHCPWLDTCIGEKNHRFFYLFLLSEAALTFWTIMIASSALVFLSDPLLALQTNGVMLCLIVFVTVSFLMSIALALMHTYVMVFNVTTWEFVSRRRITYLKDLQRDLNPFHQGIVSNTFRFLFSGCTYNWEQTYMANTAIADYYEY